MCPHSKKRRKEISQAPPHRQNPVVRDLIDDLKDEFDEWVDRASGEECHPNDWLDAGTLYDYEGNGGGQRWHTLFRLAWAHGFDSVVLPDATDGVGDGVATTWVVRGSSQIHPVPQLEASPDPEQEPPPRGALDLLVPGRHPARAEVPAHAC